MASLALAEALDLLPPWLARAAEGAGIRLLLIKGPVPAHHGLRPPQLSVDVDVLVAPDDVDRFIGLLERAGWTVHEARGPRIASQPHSVTMRHPVWPLELDVHHRFPGFLADTRVVFEALWRDRGSLRLGGHDLACTGWAGSTLIGALHVLRQPHERESERRHLASAVQEASREDLAMLLDLADLTGSSLAAGDIISRGSGISPGGRSADLGDRYRPEALAEWRIMTEAGSRRTVAWLRELGRMPVSKRPSYVVRALRGPDEAALRSRYPQAPPGVRGVRRMRRWRFREALTALVPAWWQLRRIRAAAAKDAGRR